MRLFRESPLIILFNKCLPKTVFSTRRFASSDLIFVPTLSAITNWLLEQSWIMSAPLTGNAKYCCQEFRKIFFKSLGKSVGGRMGLKLQQA